MNLKCLTQHNVCSLSTKEISSRKASENSSQAFGLEYILLNADELKKKAQEENYFETNKNEKP